MPTGKLLSNRFIKPLMSKSWLNLITLYVGCILAVVVIVAIILEMTGGSWSESLSAFTKGSLTNPGAWGNTLTFSAPLALVALGAVVSFNSGFINIGQEGQLVIGGAVAAFVGIHSEGSDELILISMLLSGALAGSSWSAIAARLRFWRGVPEVLTSLLLVFVAYQVSGYGLKETFLLADGDAPVGSRNVSSPQVIGRLPDFKIFGNSISVSIFIMLGLALVLWFVLTKTNVGFRLRLLGKSRQVAKRVGISEKRYGKRALNISGAAAGLAGAVVLASGITDFRFLPGFSLNIGWTGLLVALIARNRAWLVVPVSLLFASLHTGSQFLASTGVDRQIGNITTALFVFALLVPPAIVYFKNNSARIARKIGLPSAGSAMKGSAIKGSEQKTGGEVMS